MVSCPIVQYVSVFEHLLLHHRRLSPYLHEKAAQVSFVSKVTFFRSLDKDQQGYAWRSAARMYLFSLDDHLMASYDLNVSSLLLTYKLNCVIF